MRTRSAWLALALAILLIGCEQTDPASVIKDLDSAVNAGDVDKALALFADDATLEPNQSYDLVYTEKIEIKAWIQMQISQGLQLESSDFVITGDTVAYTLKVTQGQYTFRVKCAVVVEEGKIKSFSASATLP